jgi:hypothetical protein
MDLSYAAEAFDAWFLTDSSGAKHRGDSFNLKPVIIGILVLPSREFLNAMLVLCRRIQRNAGGTVSNAMERN